MTNLFFHCVAKRGYIPHNKDNKILLARCFPIISVCLLVSAVILGIYMIIRVSNNSADIKTDNKQERSKLFNKTN
jgi:hypothetical protein